MVMHTIPWETGYETLQTCFVRR